MKTDYEKQLQEQPPDPDIIGMICIAILILVWLAGAIWAAIKFFNL